MPPAGRSACALARAPGNLIVGSGAKMPGLGRSSPLTTRPRAACRGGATRGVSAACTTVSVPSAWSPGRVRVSGTTRHGSPSPASWLSGYASQRRDGSRVASARTRSLLGGPEARRSSSGAVRAPAQVVGPFPEPLTRASLSSSSSPPPGSRATHRRLPQMHRLPSARRGGENKFRRRRPARISHPSPPACTAHRSPA